MDAVPNYLHLFGPKKYDKKVTYKSISTYNLKTNQFVNYQHINYTNTFYYFSNKDITGVDTKDIMNPKAHGLVIITNNTNMRDFSQGIFRMRSLLEKNHQTFDIIFSNKFINIMKGGDCKSFTDFNKTDNNSREIIYNNLIIRQDIIDLHKEKILTKQNIISLYKTNNINSSLYLYIEPDNSLYEIFKKKYEKLQLLKKSKFNIDIINIIDINEKIENDKEEIYYDDYDDDDDNDEKEHYLNNNKDLDNSLIKQLIIKYFNYDLDTVDTKKNSIINNNIEKEYDFNQELIEQNSNNYNITFNLENGTINSSFVYISDNSEIYKHNQILCIYPFYIKSSILCMHYINKYDILLIYDNRNNNIVILSTYSLLKFLMYNNNISNYIFISIYNYKQFNINLDNKLDDNTLKLLFKLTFDILTNINTLKDLELLKYLTNIDYTDISNINKKNKYKITYVSNLQ